MAHRLHCSRWHIDLGCAAAGCSRAWKKSRRSRLQMEGASRPGRGRSEPIKAVQFFAFRKAGPHTCATALTGIACRPDDFLSVLT